MSWIEESPVRHLFLWVLMWLCFRWLVKRRFFRDNLWQTIGCKLLSHSIYFLCNILGYSRIMNGKWKRPFGHVECFIAMGNALNSFIWMLYTRIVSFLLWNSIVVPLLGYFHRNNLKFMFTAWNTRLLVRKGRFFKFQINRSRGICNWCCKKMQGKRIRQPFRKNASFR